MRSANTQALIQLRLEGFAVTHIPKSRLNYRSDARWHVSRDGFTNVFRSPQEAVNLLLDGLEHYSYDFRGRKWYK